MIKQGLAADDVIVVKGLQRARPGGKVVAKEEPIKVVVEQVASSRVTAPSTASISEPAATPATKKN